MLDLTPYNFLLQQLVVFLIIASLFVIIKQALPFFNNRAGCNTILYLINV